MTAVIPGPSIRSTHHRSIRLASATARSEGPFFRAVVKDEAHKSVRKTEGLICVGERFDQGVLMIRIRGVNGVDVPVWVFHRAPARTRQ